MRSFLSNARVPWLIIGFILAVGLIQTIAHADHVGPDGIVYLDIAAALRDGRWSDGLAGAWSPLYPVYLATGFTILRPDRLAEAAVAHGLHYALLIPALLSLVWLLRELARHRGVETSSFLAFSAYGLFAWATFKLLTVFLLTPDLLLAAFYLSLSALMLRLLRTETTYLDWALLGLLGALGYLTKTIFLYAIIVAFVVVLPRALSARRLLHYALAILVLLLVTGPYVWVLSQRLGRFTTGDVGALAHAWDTRGIPMAHYRGDPAIGDALVHPTRLISEAPPIYEFGGVYDVTYPVSFAPSYWYAGLARKIDFPGQARAFGRALRVLINTLDYLGLGLLALALMYVRGQAALPRGLFLIATPMIVVCGLYMATHVEPRYIAFPVVIIALVLLVTLDPPTELKRAGRAIVSATGAALLLPVLFYTGLDALKLVGRATAHNAESPHPAIARAVAQNGVAPGSRVAVVGQAYGAHWAYLADLRIIAEVDQRAAADLADPAVFSCAVNVLQRHGVVALITAGATVAPPPPGADALGAGLLLLWREGDLLAPCAR